MFFLGKKTLYLPHHWYGEVVAILHTLQMYLKLVTLSKYLTFILDRILYVILSEFAYWVKRSVRWTSATLCLLYIKWIRSGARKVKGLKQKYTCWKRNFNIDLMYRTLAANFLYLKVINAIVHVQLLLQLPTGIFHDFAVLDMQLL